METRQASPLLSNLMKHRILTSTEELRLIKQAQTGNNTARDTIVLHNLRLVGQTANKYSKYTNSMSFDDLMHEGVLGLLYAINKFDTTTKHKLSTYAKNWIDFYIQRATTNTDETIRLPVHVDKAIRKAKASAGRDATHQTILQHASKDASIALLNGTSGRVESLNEPLKIDGTSTLLDILTQTSTHEETSITTTTTTYEKRVKAAMLGLNKIEQTVITLYWGLNDTTPLGVGQIATHLKTNRTFTRRTLDSAHTQLAELLKPLPTRTATN
jgi:RNA polymerase sigma factor (sigma-70 family)